MGLGGISIWQLLIVLAIVVMVFGTKRLRNMGGDLGSAIKGFRSAMKEGDDDKQEAGKQDDDPQVIEQNSEADANADQQDDAAHRTKDSADQR